MDHGLHGDKNLVGFSVIFQKSPIPRQKHKSPSSIRRSQLRKEIRRQQRSQQHGLGIQATSTSSSSSQPGSSLSLISGQPTTTDSTSNTSSEHKTTTNNNVSSIRIDHSSNSASSTETLQLTGRPIGTTSSAVVSTYPNPATTSSSYQSPTQRSTIRVPGPLLVLRATLDDGTVASSSSSSVSSSRAKPSAPTKSSRQSTTRPAFDLPASLPQLEASTRSDSLHDQLPQASLQSFTPTQQTTTQFKLTQQADFSIGVGPPALSGSGGVRRTSRHRPKTFTPDPNAIFASDIEDL